MIENLKSSLNKFKFWGSVGIQSRKKYSILKSIEVFLENIFVVLWCIAMTSIHKRLSRYNNNILDTLLATL